VDRDCSITRGGPDYSEFASIPTSTGATELNPAFRGSGSFLVKLQWVQLSSKNRRKHEEVSVCNSSFQIPTLRTRLIFRRGALLGYKEKGELVRIVRLLMS